MQKKINEMLGNQYNEERLRDMVSTYNELKSERKNIVRTSSTTSFICPLTPVPNLSSDNDEVWGSKRQYLYGYVCSEILKSKKNVDIAPFLCTALNPTGGICGPGNQSLYKGSVTDPLIVHSCIHDASGYCYNYHKTGLGYNYLNTFFALPTSMPMSCQFMG